MLRRVPRASRASPEMPPLKSKREAPGPSPAPPQSTRNFIKARKPTPRGALTACANPKGLAKKKKGGGVFRKTSPRDYERGSTGPCAAPRRGRSPRNREAGRETAGRKFVYLQVAKAPCGASLLQWDEPGGVGGPDARPAVLHRLVGDGELPQVVTDHFGLEENGEIRGGGGEQGQGLQLPPGIA